MSLIGRVRRMAQRAGYDITRFPDPAAPRARCLRAVVGLRPTVVLDVGANAGQYAGELRRAGYAGSIVSFEPLPDAFEQLTRASRDDRAWQAVNSAVGADDTTAKLHVAGNSWSSSLRPMLRRHEDAAPTSKNVGAVDVAVGRLDRLAAPFVGDDDRVFVKIDTQGYEAQVIEGAPQVLSRCIGLQVEMSLVPLYEGQALFDDVYSTLREQGFTLVGLEPSFWDPTTGSLLQFDAVLARDRAD